MRIVIVGNGVAGIEAALAVRARQPGWTVTIVSEESDHFFSRTALMWVFTGQMSHRDIEPHERDLYERHGFVRVRARAIGIDPQRKVLRLSGEPTELCYDRLLLACGSRARPSPWPGADADGIGTFVTLQDLEWLEREVHGGPSRAGRPPRPDDHVPRTTPSSPYRPRRAAREQRGRRPTEPAVIGGGLIGIEAAEILCAAGLAPRFFIREAWFWPMALDRREAAFVTERMRAHGVIVHVEEEIVRFESDGGDNVARVITDHGEHAADLVVVAIGVVPNTEWLRESGLQIEDVHGGVVVDRGLVTSDPHVLAAGDCASVRWPDGAHRHEPLWYTARDQGRIAGRALLGEDVRYERGTWYNSAKLFDIEYTTAGVIGPAPGAEPYPGERHWFFEETGPVRSTTRIVTHDDRVVGFNLLGRRWDHNVLIEWIEEGRSLANVLEHLAEASFDTEFVPPLRVPRGQPNRAESAR